MKEVEVYRLLFDIADIMDDTSLDADGIRNAVRTRVQKWTDDELKFQFIIADDELKNNLADTLHEANEQIQKGKKFIMNYIDTILLVMFLIVAFFPILDWYLKHFFK